MQGDLIIGLVVDMSGSMAHVTEQTIQSVNDLVSEQAGQAGRTWVTTTLFNSNEITTLYRMEDASSAPTLDTSIYRPDYGTPLHDAIGRTLRYMSEDIDTLPLDAHDAKKLFVIVTDGQENQSKEFKLDGIKELIAQRTAEGWDFLYLGAGIDSFGAEQMGILRNSTVSYAHNAATMHATTQSLSSNVSAYRGGVGSVADVAANVQADADASVEGDATVPAPPSVKPKRRKLGPIEGPRSYKDKY